ncbi:MAG: hypothetical protein PHI28_07435 [Mangrovibacterium sp.]|nr:hypothetical protein [Mangrovibacterium sp.]
MKNNRKLIIYLICVGIATIFWFLNALNKQYAVELTFPVKYTNWPANKILINNPPDRFVLKVNSFGFTILRYKLSMAFSPLVFNVNNFTERRLTLSDQSKYAIPTRPLIYRLSEQVSNELNITDIHPDTLVFLFDKVTARNVPVKPDVSFELKQQHFLNDVITTIPDSVRVTGPGSVLDTLRFVTTTQQHFKNVDRTIRQNLPLQPVKNLTLGTNRVLLEIPVEEFTEKQLIAPVTITNLPPGLRVNLFPGQVNVSFMIALSRFKEVKPGDFKVSASYEDIKNRVELLRLKIEAQPPFVHSVVLYPEHVEYLIEK